MKRERGAARTSSPPPEAERRDENHPSEVRAGAGHARRTVPTILFHPVQRLCAAFPPIPVTKHPNEHAIASLQDPGANIFVPPPRA
jgi:hypothetical protein